MNICIAGWYFDKPFLDILHGNIHGEFPVTVVANRDGLPDGYDFDYHVRENKGLEYGAYDYFLQNCWDGDDVLFLHDDMTIQPIIKNFEIVNPLLMFRTISNLDGDLTYIFKHEADRRTCFGIHGRAMFAKSSFLKALKDTNGGFPWDENNDGHTFGNQPSYCEHYNWAVEKLKDFWEVRTLTGCKVGSVIIPALAYHIRGRKP